MMNWKLCYIRFDNWKKISEEDMIEPGKREGIYCTVYKHLQSYARTSMGKFKKIYSCILIMCASSYDKYNGLSVVGYQ